MVSTLYRIRQSTLAVVSSTGLASASSFKWMILHSLVDSPSFSYACSETTPLRSPSLRLSRGGLLSLADEACCFHVPASSQFASPAF